MKAKRALNSGMSLVEVMIAIGLTSFVLFVIGIMMSNNSKGLKATQGRAEVTNILNTIPGYDICKTVQLAVQYLVNENLISPTKYDLSDPNKISPPLEYADIDHFNTNPNLDPEQIKIVDSTGNPVQFPGFKVRFRPARQGSGANEFAYFTLQYIGFPPRMLGDFDLTQWGDAFGIAINKRYLANVYQAGGLCTTNSIVNVPASPPGSSTAGNPAVPPGSSPASSPGGSPPASPPGRSGVPQSPPASPPVSSPASPPASPPVSSPASPPASPPVSPATPPVSGRGFPPMVEGELPGGGPSLPVVPPPPPPASPTPTPPSCPTSMATLKSYCIDVCALYGGLSSFSMSHCGSAGAPSPVCSYTTIAGQTSYSNCVGTRASDNSDCCGANACYCANGGPFTTTACSHSTCTNIAVPPPPPPAPPSIPSPAFPPAPPPPPPSPPGRSSTPVVI